MLDPGRGRTKTGQLWAYARDDRPWGGTDPPASPTSMRPTARPSGRSRILPASTASCRSTATPAIARSPRRGDVQLAFCWAHVRRRFYELAAAGPAPIASEALERIAALYADRERDPRPQRRGAPRRPPGEEPAASSTTSKPWLRDKARPDQPEDQARRGDPLRALALGRL